MQTSCLLVFAIASFLTMGLPDPQKKQTGKPSAPAKVSLVWKRSGKPPLRYFHVKLELTNRYDRPIWLLTSCVAETPLNASGKFAAGMFVGKRYDGWNKRGKAAAVEVEFIGHFRALFLPPKTTLTFDDFSLESGTDVESCEFWEVSSLQVNTRTSLDKWLPYKVLSDADTRIPAETDWKNLDWDSDRLGSRVDYPKESVKSVTATVIKKWTVPIEGAKKQGSK
jgi:hypothetical protein